MKTSDKCHFTLICLGSNDFSIFGDLAATIQKAMLLVGELSTFPAKCSRLYRTPAFPAGVGPDFVNAAVAIGTQLSPETMLDRLHEIETLAGRERKQRWGQRTLDLDLIAMDDLICPDWATFEHWLTLDAATQQTKAPDRLILPHPRMQDRSFVLAPLADVAPGWLHPVLGKTIGQMLADRPASERESVVLAA